MNDLPAAPNRYALALTGLPRNGLEARTANVIRSLDLIAALAGRSHTIDFALHFIAIKFCAPLLGGGSRPCLHGSFGAIGLGTLRGDREQWS